MPSCSCVKGAAVAAVHHDDGLGQRPEGADRHRPGVDVRAEDAVRVAVPALDDLVEDGAVQREERARLAHASFASVTSGCAAGWVIRAIAPSGMGSQDGRLRAS